MFGGIVEPYFVCFNYWNYWLENDLALDSIENFVKLFHGWNI